MSEWREEEGGRAQSLRQGSGRAGSSSMQKSDGCRTTSKNRKDGIDSLSCHRAVAALSTPRRVAVLESRDPHLASASSTTALGLPASFQFNAVLLTPFCQFNHYTPLSHLSLDQGKPRAAADFLAPKTPLAQGADQTLACSHTNNIIVSRFSSFDL